MFPSETVIGLPEVFYQHQVIDGGVDAGEEDRAAVGRGGEAEPDVAEVAGHGLGPACREVEEL